MNAGRPASQTARICRCYWPVRLDIRVLTGAPRLCYGRPRHEVKRCDGEGSPRPRASVIRKEGRAREDPLATPYGLDLAKGFCQGRVVQHRRAERLARGHDDWSRAFPVLRRGNFGAVDLSKREK